jgi:hypothetical protein
MKIYCIAYILEKEIYVHVQAVLIFSTHYAYINPFAFSLFGVLDAGECDPLGCSQHKLSIELSNSARDRGVHSKSSLKEI